MQCVLFVLQHTIVQLGAVSKGSNRMLAGGAAPLWKCPLPLLISVFRALFCHGAVFLALSFSTPWKCPYRESSMT